MKEKLVESVLVNTVSRMRGLCWKFLSSRAGVPDRIVMLPVPEEHRELVARYFRFVETKRPGQQVSKQQAFVHEKIRELGFVVDVVSTTDQARGYLGEGR